MTVFSTQVVGSVTVTPAVAPTPYFFYGANVINQIGSGGTQYPCQIFHAGGTVLVGTVIPAYKIGTERMISIAGSLAFTTLATIGASIGIGDRVEFYYRGHPAFYGWVYAVNKNSDYTYDFTAYDGGYGLAQAVSNAGDISRDSAVLGVSDLLKSYALQVGGLGATQTERMGINIPAGEIPQIFGWGFSSGQVLQKIESIAQGFGYTAYTDAVGNLMLTNYRYLPSNAAVGTITLTENRDVIVGTSKNYDPSEEYGNWTVVGEQDSGGIITGVAGIGKPSRTLGSDWLFVTASDQTNLTNIALQYQATFENGVWTAVIMTNRWFDVSGVDILGSINAYIGDNKYWFTCVPSVGVFLSPVTGGTVPIVTKLQSGFVGGAYVRNSESPEYCVVAGTQISRLNGFMTGNMSIAGTIGVAGSLRAQNIDYDGQDTLFTASTAGAIYATNWYMRTTSQVASVSGTINTIASQGIGQWVVGTSSGAVVSVIGTIAGTTAYNVTGLIVDAPANWLYACTGGSLIPYWFMTNTGVLGTVNVGTFVPGGVLMGAAIIGGNGLLLAGTNTVAFVQQYTINGALPGGTVLQTLTLPAGWKIQDVDWDADYSIAAVTACGTQGTWIFEYSASITGTVQLTGGPIYAPGRYPVFIGTQNVFAVQNFYQWTIAPYATIHVSTVAATFAQGSEVSITRQNLYTLNFADGTTLYNCIVQDVQVSQTGVQVTFKSGETVTTSFVASADDTQLALFNVVAVQSQG
jgi:hypothetical protein